MKALRVLEVKTFMAQLFLGESFDMFLLHEMEVHTANVYKINGRLNRAWLDTQELLELGNREFSRWKELRNFSFQIIKGSKSPHKMKLVFSLPEENVEKVVERSGGKFSSEQVEGLFLNIKYENGVLHLVTGVSLKVFSMDKSLEQEWDREILAFLKNKNIPCEEI